MNWLSQLEQMEEYYRWKRDNHPAYPDLMLEWGLFHHLYGETLEEAGDGRRAAACVKRADETLRSLIADGCEFHDLNAWSAWAAEQMPADAPRPDAPSPSALLDHFRGDGDLARAALQDELLIRIGELGEAPAAVRRAALCTAFRRVFASMGESFAHRGQDEIANVYFAWAVLVGGDYARYWVYQARLNRVMAREDNLEDILARGLESYPDNIELVREMALELDRKGESDRAVEYMTRAVELRPEWPDLRYELARMLRENESPEASLVHFDKALEINPGYGKAAVSRVEALIDVGEIEAAERDLLDLKEQDVEPRRVYRLLSQIYAERRDPRRAEQFGVLGQEVED